MVRFHVFSYRRYFSAAMFIIYSSLVRVFSILTIEGPLATEASEVKETHQSHISNVFYTSMLEHYYVDRFSVNGHEKSLTLFVIISTSRTSKGAQTHS